MTVVGFAVTIILGLQQLDQSRQSRDDERFDKAVARLAGSTSAERLSGVAGLGLFLDAQHEARHRATLRFLVNALAVEPDATVRGGLLDTFSSLTSGQISQNDLSDTLDRLRDRNRSLYQQFQADFVAKRIRLGPAFPKSGFDETHILPDSEGALAPLRATAAAITSLVRNGAKTKDLSKIYCVGCDFTGIDWEMINPNFAKIADFAHRDAAQILDLSAINFDGAILKNANFIGLNLRNASFDGADLVHANFSGADLRGARLSDYGGRNYLLEFMQTTGGLIGYFPEFTCANLSGADFTKSLFFAIYSRESGFFQGGYPTLQNADLEDARLGEVTVVTVRPADLNHDPSPLEAISLQAFTGYEGGASYGALNLPGQSKTLKIETYLSGPNFAFKEPVPTDLWPSIQDVFSNLTSSHNLNQSRFPNSLKSFLTEHQKSFLQSPHPTPCTTPQ